MAAETDFAELARACRETPPALVVVLGSGMGAVAERVRKQMTLSFAEASGLPAAAVPGHRGCLSLGEWVGQRLLLFEGRVHFYEGHAWSAVVRPIEIAASLGARLALLSNAAGGIADRLAPGTRMCLRDHIDCTRPFWWRQPGPAGLGGERPSPYSPRLREVLCRAARQCNQRLPEGVYASLTGPCYETPAEIRALRRWGADAVGMSTAREIEAGAALGLECAAIAAITNRAAGLSDSALNHEEVLASAAAESEHLADLIENFLRLLTP